MIWFQRTGLLLAVLVIVFLCVWLLSDLHKAETSEQPQTEYPDAYMLDVTATQMNDKGTVDSVLRSPQMIHFKKDNSTLMTNPDMYSYSTNAATWHVTAVHGKAFDGLDYIHLWKDVKAHQIANKNNPPVTITTSRATVFPHKKLITTKQPATLVQPGATVNSVGFKADMRAGEVTLLSKASGIYNPQGSKNDNTQRRTS